MCLNLNKFSFRLRSALTFLLVSFSLAGQPGLLKAGDLLDVAFEAAEKLTRLKLNTSGKISFVRPYSFNNPARLMIDIQGLSSLPDSYAGTGIGAVDHFRIARTGENHVRIILDLNTPIEFVRLLEVPTVGDTTVSYLLDFRPVSQGLYAQNVIRSRERLASLAESRMPLRDEKPDFITDNPLVIIDPGHGGKDYGASISGLTPEKDLVLAFALALKQRLIAAKNIDVLLTREDDRFVDLKTRIELARRYRADLFLSIHIDKNADPRVSGASIYTLSDKASNLPSGHHETQHKDTEPDRLLLNSRPEIDRLLQQFMRRETKAFSENIADLFLIALQSASTLLKNPKRSANFYILKAPDVPSLLIELGFMSNKNDAEKLSSESWRATMAEAMTIAIIDYFERRRRF